jgi:hypothetical protein
MASKIINDNFAIISILVNRKKINCSIIALMLCETHFSSAFKRIVEYFLWFILTIINCEKRFYISVGIGQIQIRHWLFYGLINDKINVSNFSKFINIVSNYELIEIILVENLIIDSDDSKLVGIYRGESRAYHLALYSELKKQLNALILC